MSTGIKHLFTQHH